MEEMGEERSIGVLLRMMSGLGIGICEFGDEEMGGRRLCGELGE